MTNLPFIGRFQVTCVYRKKGSWAAGFHTGVDLVGTDRVLYSVCDGKVIMAKSYGNYGRAVKVKDDVTGRIFLYAHLESYAVKVGDKVTRKSRIGIMGNTGNSTGPHLHIEMRTPADQYGVVEDITAYMGIPNRQGIYNSEDYQIKENEGGTLEMAKVYQNGSTPEDVFAESSLKTKIGTLNPNETAEYLSIDNDRPLVRYKIDGTNNYKVGYVAWKGGCK